MQINLGGYLLKQGFFYVASAWNQLRHHRPIVAWWKIIWFPKAIPRCEFIAWLAIRNRLSTKERLVNRGLAIDALCLMCRATVRVDIIFSVCFLQENLDEDEIWVLSRIQLE